MFGIELLILRVGHFRDAHEEWMRDLNQTHGSFIPIGAGILLRAPWILEGLLPLRLSHLESAGRYWSHKDTYGVCMRLCGTGRQRRCKKQTQDARDHAYIHKIFRACDEV